MEEQKVLSDRYRNNFDFLRFVAASLVIISHSVPLSNNGIEILAYLSKNQETFGGLAVGIFFIISGYLICASFIRTNNLIKYFVARILRIFPALIVVVLIATFIVGPIATNLSLKDYLFNSYTWSYLKTITLYPIQFSLPGVIFSEGKHGVGINGSLWTLSYEFTCYILVALLGILKLLRKEIILFLFIIFIFSIQFSDNIFPNSKTSTFLLPYISQFYFIKLSGWFLSGMVFYLYKDTIEYNFRYFIISVFIFLLCLHYGVGYKIIFPTFGAYIIFYIAFCKRIKLQNFSKYGDFSYGIYIYGFMIQQCVVRLFGGRMDAKVNVLIALPIAIICGVLSWHIIEKRCLALKTGNKLKHNKSFHRIRSTCR